MAPDSKALIPPTVADDFLAQFALRMGLPRDTAETALGELLLRYHQTQSARARATQPRSERSEATESLTAATPSN